MPSISDKFAAELDVLVARHEAQKVELDAQIARVRSIRKDIERLHKELLILEAE